jgi:hypothetical protein
MRAQLSQERCDELYMAYMHDIEERDDWQRYIDTELATEHGLASQEDLSYAQDNVGFWDREANRSYDNWSNSNCSET